VTARQAAVAASFSLILVVAIGLAAGLLGTSGRLASFAAESLSSPAVTLPAVLAAGLTDGINPCAFTVLLLFVASVASAYRSLDGTDVSRARMKIILLGTAFIAAIFAVYLALGVGLFRASSTLTQNHLGARIGALAAVFMGLWMLKDAFLPGWGPRLSAPSGLTRIVHSFGHRATLGSMLVLGGLVGLCTVPCSGAVYLAVLSLLALQTSFVLAYLYLLLYNLAFILPLAVILAVASARPALGRLAHWNNHHRERVRFALGAAVSLMGLVILATV
jgi:cytochrome c biogenesis protein CcdA